ncbi:P-II family nitrogen regulator [Sphingomonas mesophila]|uniref:P-II family nitrogen regulator n=1 Tax=Sphingomonas mesophila TaxID=2303576 RepID=UPI000E593F1D|nr:transcriptional regulator [Sphingomonas mesophila]
MIQTTTKKRFEILIEEQILPLLARVIRDAGFSGHTVMPVLSGEGGHGRWQDERLTSSSRVMVLAIGGNEEAERLMTGLAPILDSHRLLLTITDCQIIRQERF